MGVRCACIDIGSNTIRLLVADCDRSSVVPVVQRRAFTRLGRACRTGAPLEGAALAGLVELVADYAEIARTARAAAVRIIATAALRRISNGAVVCAIVEDAARHPVEVIGEAEEGRLAFAGATAAVSAAADVPLAVVDVGGGSSELVVGSRRDGVAWSRSLPLGSGDLADRFLAGDPPTATEMAAVEAAVATALREVAVPSSHAALAIGGGVKSLAQLVGPLLDSRALRQARDLLTADPAAVVAARHGLDRDRIPLAAAGVAILSGIVASVGPLTVARGGVREGAILALATP